MKKILTILATVSLFALTATSVRACDEPRRVVGYTQCGTPIFATLEVVGYNHCGQPIMQWVTHYPRETEHHDSYRDYDRGDYGQLDYDHYSPRYSYQRHSYR